MKKRPNTTIQIRKITKQHLSAIGKKGQTYDDILKILISDWNE